MTEVKQELRNALDDLEQMCQTGDAMHPYAVALEGVQGGSGGAAEVDPEELDEIDHEEEGEEEVPKKKPRKNHPKKTTF